jgi:hypothetical protein
VESVDGGGFWSPVGRGLTEPRFTGPLLVDPRRPATVYGGVFFGVARSRNGGLDFPYVARLDPCALDTALRAAPGGALWAGASDFGDQCSDEAAGGAFLSIDGGTTWSHADAGLPRLVDDLVVDPAAPTTLYAAVPGGSGGVWRTADRGASWQRTAFEIPADSRLTALAIAGGSPSTVYAGVSGPEGGVWASHDAGATWARLGGDELEGLQVRDLTFDPRSRTLYAATTAGVFKLAPE